MVPRLTIFALLPLGSLQALAQGAAPDQKVPLPQLMPIYLTYLTAVPSGTQIVYFDDFYGRDRMAVRRG